MTLIPTAAQSQGVLHVSDRQVTLIRGGKPVGNHPTENKTVIFTASDGVGVLGYTGSAYVGTKTTDTWLAQTIFGEAIDSRLSYRMGGKRSPRLNTILQRLRSAMRSGKLGRKDRLALSIVGFRRRRGRAVPYTVELNWPNFADDSALMRGPREARQTAILTQIGDPFEWDETLRIAKSEAAKAQSEGHPTPLLEGLAAVIRERSKVSALVGSNLMAVYIPPPFNRRVEWQFMPTTSHRAVLQTPRISMEFEATFSPWIVAGGAVMAPTLGRGHMTLHAGGWTIEPVGEAATPPAPMPSPSGGRVFFATSSQSRPPPPR